MSQSKRRLGDFVDVLSTRSVGSVEASNTKALSHKVTKIHYFLFCDAWCLCVFVLNLTGSLLRVHL